MSTWRPQEAARFKTMVGRAAIPAGSSPLAVVQVILPGSVLKPRIRGGGGSTDGNGGSRRRGRAGRHGHTGRTGAAGGSVEGDVCRRRKPSTGNSRCLIATREKLHTPNSNGREGRRNARWRSQGRPRRRKRLILQYD